jgi:hypothetical protein
MYTYTKEWTYFTSDGRTPISIGASVAVLKTSYHEDWRPPLDSITIMTAIKARNKDYIGVLGL